MEGKNVLSAIPFGKFKGYPINDMDKDYMKKFVKYKRFTANKGFIDRVRKSKFSYLIKDKKNSSLRKPKKTVKKKIISENPSLKKMQDTFKLLQGASMSELSAIMSDPGALNLNGEELAEKLKNNIVSAINPNPEKVEEIKKKTEIWLEGLKKQTKIDYEQLTMNLHPRARSKYPPYEVYYDNIETVDTILLYNLLPNTVSYWKDIEVCEDYCSGKFSKLFNYFIKVFPDQID